MRRWLFSFGCALSLSLSLTALVARRPAKIEILYYEVDRDESGAYDGVQGAADVVMQCERSADCAINFKRLGIQSAHPN